jgi:hypothetical protein
MIRGYFVHKFPEAIPASYGFAFVLGMIGIQKDPTFDINWQKVSRIHRGIYQRPMVTVDDDAYKHSAFLVELCQYNNPAWNDMPLLINALMPAVDLTFLDVWIDRVTTQLSPKVKPLIYITQKHWLEIQSGPNAEVVSKRILLKANILSSQYKVSLPETPLYVDRLKYWEYENGKMQFDEYGKFEAVNVPTPPPPPPAGDELPIVHSCPHCGKHEAPIIYTCGYCGKKVKIFE